MSLPFPSFLSILPLGPLSSLHSFHNLFPFFPFYSSAGKVIAAPQQDKTTSQLFMCTFFLVSLFQLMAMFGIILHQFELDLEASQIHGSLS